MSIFIATITVLIGLLITRPFTTFIHELGHGIPAYFLTKEKIGLYIGSYRNVKKSFKFSSGRIDVFFKYNPFLWNTGMCTFQQGRVNQIHDFIITLAGPVASLILGVVSYYFVRYDGLHGGIRLFFAFLMVSSVLDFFGNIIPSFTPIYSDDGSTFDNDGRRLISICKSFKQGNRERKKNENIVCESANSTFSEPDVRNGLIYENYNLNKEYNYTNNNGNHMNFSFDELIHYGNIKFQERKFEDACFFYEAALKLNPQNKWVLNNRACVYLNLGKYEEVVSDLNQVISLYPDFVDAWNNRACAYTNLGKHEEAISDLNQAISLNPNFSNAWNNRGYSYLVIEEYKKAIPDFDKAISLNPDQAYAYNNRGLAKIKTDFLEDGLKDIEHSLALDSKNSYAHRNLGIYFFDKGDFVKALNCFEKAEMLNPKTPILNDYLSRTRELLKNE